jgi:Xaa-Pro aminopeptidase
VVVDEVFDALRAVKSQEEIRMLSDSLGIAEATVGRLQREMTPRVTGHGLVSSAKRIMYELGATGVDHTTIAIGNTNPEIPEDVTAKSDDLIVLDVGSILHGYVSDNRRLAYIGSVPRALREKNETMAKMVVDTGMSARIGMSFPEMCGKTESRYADLGMDPMFLSVGHTIGIQTEELWITRDSPKKFEKGMVFNIELYTRVEPATYVGTEDTFVLQDDGCKRISTLSHDIAEIA